MEQVDFLQEGECGVNGSDRTDRFDASDGDNGAQLLLDGDEFSQLFVHRGFRDRMYQRGARPTLVYAVWEFSHWCLYILKLLNIGLHVHVSCLHCHWYTCLQPCKAIEMGVFTVL